MSNSDTTNPKQNIIDLDLDDDDDDVQYIDKFPATSFQTPPRSNRPSLSNPTDLTPAIGNLELSQQFSMSIPPSSSSQISSTTIDLDPSPGTSVPLSQMFNASQIEVMEAQSSATQYSQSSSQQTSPLTATTPNSTKKRRKSTGKDEKLAPFPFFKYVAGISQFYIDSLATPELKTEYYETLFIISEKFKKVKMLKGDEKMTTNWKAIPPSILNTLHLEMSVSIPASVMEQFKTNVEPSSLNTATSSNSNDGFILKQKDLWLTIKNYIQAKKIPCKIEVSDLAKNEIILTLLKNEEHNKIIICREIIPYLSPQEIGQQNEKVFSTLLQRLQVWDQNCKTQQTGRIFICFLKNFMSVYSSTYSKTANGSESPLKQTSTTMQSNEEVVNKNILDVIRRVTCIHFLHLDAPYTFENAQQVLEKLDFFLEIYLENYTAAQNQPITTQEENSDPDSKFRILLTGLFQNEPSHQDIVNLISERMKSLSRSLKIIQQILETFPIKQTVSEGLSAEAIEYISTKLAGDWKKSVQMSANRFYATHNYEKSAKKFVQFLCGGITKPNNSSSQHTFVMVDPSHASSSAATTSPGTNKRTQADAIGVPLTPSNESADNTDAAGFSTPSPKRTKNNSQQSSPNFYTPSTQSFSPSTITPSPTSIQLSPSVTPSANISPFTTRIAAPNPSSQSPNYNTTAPSGRPTSASNRISTGNTATVQMMNTNQEGSSTNLPQVAVPQQSSTPFLTTANGAVGVFVPLGPNLSVEELHRLIQQVQARQNQ